MATAQVRSQPADPTADVLNQSKGGFNFENCLRNARLLESLKTAGGGALPTHLPKFTKTGTTIAGVTFKGGVVLGADTRSTAGPVVANKNCVKIHYMAPNVYCCGAGTAADCDQVGDMMASQLTLLRLNTGEPTRVVCALTRLKRFLFRYQGYVGAYLVLGGVDDDGSHLHTVWAQGSTSTLPYVTMGSGSLAAMSIFEAEFKKDMTKEEAMELVQRGILSGINNDMGSGSNVDLVVITKDGVEKHRNRFKTQIPQSKSKDIKFPHGTTPVLGKPRVTVFKKVESLFDVRISEEVEEEKKDDGMDVDS